MVHPSNRLSLAARAELIEQIRSLRHQLGASISGGDKGGAEDVAEELQALMGELAEYQAEAEATRERYATLFEYGPVAYVLLDRYGVISSLNHRAAALLGEDRRPILGKPFLVYVQAQDRRQFLDHMRRCRVGRGEVASEVTLRMSRERFAPVRLISHALPALSEEQLYQTALLDLTERKQAEDRLRVTERLASLGTMLAGLAHEINNPLNSILLSGQVALKVARGESLNPQVAESLVQILEQIVEEARRGGRLVRNMLASAKQENTQKWPADLNTVVRRAVTLAQAEYKDRCHTRLQLTPDLPQVAINPTEIEQVVTNLMRNAVEASGGECRMLIKTERGDASVRLMVADDGPGIPRDKLPHIFDPFFTTKRGAGGTGLGLSIVYAIVAGHGGVIDVKSEPGVGTRFLIDLPIHSNGEYHGKDTGR